MFQVVTNDTYYQNEDDGMDCPHLHRIIDDESADLVCMDCGLVLDERMPVYELDAYDALPYRVSAKYKRTSYFNELVRQWCQAEPSIHLHHLHFMVEFYHIVYKHKSENQEHVPVFNKKSIQRFLTHANDYFGLKQLKKLYLEKWRSLLTILEPNKKHTNIQKFPIYDHSWRRDFFFIFKACSASFDRLIKNSTQFKRKSMPYVSVIRKILVYLATHRQYLDREGKNQAHYLLHYVNDWPESRSKDKKKECEEIVEIIANDIFIFDK